MNRTAQNICKLLVDASNCADEIDLLESSVESRTLRVAALEASILIHSNQLSHNHAIAAIRAVRRTDRNMQQLTGIETPECLRIGVELLEAEVISEDELIELIDFGVRKKAAWDSPAIQTQLLTNFRAVAAKYIKRLADERRISFSSAKDLCEKLTRPEHPTVKELSEKQAVKQLQQERQAKQFAQPKQSKQENSFALHSTNNSIPTAK